MMICVYSFVCRNIVTGSSFPSSSSLPPPSRPLFSSRYFTQCGWKKGPSGVLLFLGRPREYRNCEVVTREKQGMSVYQFTTLDQHNTQCGSLNMYIITLSMQAAPDTGIKIRFCFSAKMVCVLLLDTFVLYITC
jgi:hypothetical protein